MLVGGADTLIWTSTDDIGASVADADLISDFDPTFDRIALRQIDAGAKAPGDQAFEFIGMADYTAAGQVRWSTAAHMIARPVMIGGKIARTLKHLRETEIRNLTTPNIPRSEHSP
jgi:hypothetical protein